MLVCPAMGTDQRTSIGTAEFIPHSWPQNVSFKVFKIQEEEKPDLQIYERKHPTGLCFLSDITFSYNWMPASLTCSTHCKHSTFFFFPPQKSNFSFAKQVTREPQVPLSCIQKLILQPSDGCAEECLINVHGK